MCLTIKKKEKSTTSRQTPSWLKSSVHFYDIVLDRATLCKVKVIQCNAYHKEHFHLQLVGTGQASKSLEATGHGLSSAGLVQFRTSGLSAKTTQTY